MSDVLTEARFWAQVMDDARRVVLCPPELAELVQGWVAGRGMDSIIEVRPHRACPPDTVMVLDEQALRADLNERIQRRRYSPFSRATTAPPCPVCEREVDSVTSGAEDRQFGSREVEVVKAREPLTLSPCGHLVASYVQDEAGNVLRWRP